MNVELEIGQNYDDSLRKYQGSAPMQFWPGQNPYQLNVIVVASKFFLNLTYNTLRKAPRTANPSALPKAVLMLLYLVL